MNPLIVRYSAALTGTSGRTVFGVLCPFNRVEKVSDDGGRSRYNEQFMPGAFTRTIAERGHKVLLLGNHDTRKFPLGRAVELQEKADGLHGAFAVAATREGDDVLELVRSGLVGGFSVGFSPKRHTRNKDGVVSRTEVGLGEVSLTAYPAYEGALVGGVRDLSPIVQTPRLSVARRRLQLLELE